MALLDALPRSARENVETLSAKRGQTHVDVLAAAVESFFQIQELGDACVGIQGKRENPKIVRLVPDPEHRRIYRAVTTLIARDATEGLTKKDIAARGRAGGLARSVHLPRSEQPKSED